MNIAKQGLSITMLLELVHRKCYSRLGELSITYIPEQLIMMSGTGRGGSRGGGGGLWGCNPPKALETHREQCAGVKIYSILRAQSTVQPERE